MSFEAMSWAVKQKLPALQKIVLLMLADRTNKDTGRCDPSITRLADDCGMSERSTRNAIRELEKLGLIETIHRSNEGVNLPNHYRLKMQDLEGVGHDMPQGTAGDAPGVGHDVPTNQEVKPVIKPIFVDDTKNVSSTQCPHLEIISLYNEILPELQQVIPDRWDGTRKKNLQARWRESQKHQSLDFWKRFFTALRNYQWYLGANDRGWKANLGWIVDKRNFDNLIEKFVSDSRKSATA